MGLTMGFFLTGLLFHPFALFMSRKLGVPVSEILNDPLFFSLPMFDFFFYFVYPGADQHFTSSPYLTIKMKES